MKKIFALSGSTRSASVNLGLIKAVAQQYASQLTFDIFEGLEQLPQFNPDKDIPGDTILPEIAAMRQRMRAADGILICTPEYAMGLPGALKNALDWTVSSCEFSGKPVAVVTAASMGEKTHASLLGTLRIIEASVTDDCQLLIPFAQAKIGKEGIIKDTATAAQIQLLMDSFIGRL
jgi:NAD(P)H-dependent FMN reductase